MWRLIAFAWILFSQPSVCASVTDWKGTAEGGFSVEISLSKTTLTLDDPLRVAITVEYPEAYTPDLGELRRNLLSSVELSEPPFALVDEAIHIPSEGNMHILFSLEPQLLGSHAITFYAISFLPKHPEIDPPVEIISEIFSVAVVAPSIEEPFQGVAAPLLSVTERMPMEINDRNRLLLLDNVQEGKREAVRNEILFRRRSLPWATFFAILLLGLLVLMMRMRPKKAPRERGQQQKILSARAKALQSLKVLQRDDWIREKGFDTYYSLLTLTVRNYLEERFGLKATTQTTQEFLEEAVNNPVFDQEAQQLLATFMIRCDAIKFAEQTPSSIECKQAHQAAEKLVNTRCAN